MTLSTNPYPRGDNHNGNDATVRTSPAEVFQTPRDYLSSLPTEYLADMQVLNPHQIFGQRTKLRRMLLRQKEQCFQIQRPVPERRCCSIQLLSWEIAAKSANFFCTYNLPALEAAFWA